LGNQLFERQWLVKNCRHGQSEMVPLSRWQVGAALGIEPHDLGVEMLLHSEVPTAIYFVFHMVAMLPLIPGEMMELNKETFGPSLAGFAEPFLVVVALLKLSPGLGEESFEKVLPADRGLGGNDLIDFIILEVGKGEGIVAPSVEAGQQRGLEAWMGVSFLKVLGELGDAFIPDITGSFSNTPQNMSGVLRGSTPRAFVVILVLPLDESLAHTAFGRGMLGNPSPAGRLQGFHAGPTGVPVDDSLGIIGEPLVSDPVELSDGILDGFV